MQKRIYAPVPPDVEKVGKAVLDAAFKVHTALGPGLLESVYETCTKFELTESGLSAPTQVGLTCDVSRYQNGCGFETRYDRERLCNCRVQVCGDNASCFRCAVDHLFEVDGNSAWVLDQFQCCTFEGWN